MATATRSRTTRPRATRRRTPRGASAGANGDGNPKQGDPVQQVPTDTSTVKLDNIDAKWSAKLTSSKGNSLEIWGDPHVVINIDGKEQKFEIGYGPGSATLSDGSIVKWDTYEPGKAHQYILRAFSIDSPGTANDRSVTTADGKDETGMTTALNDTQLRELAAALGQYKAPMNTALKITTPATPDPREGTDRPGG